MSEQVTTLSGVLALPVCILMLDHFHCLEMAFAVEGLSWYTWMCVEPGDLANKYFILCSSIIFFFFYFFSFS